VIIRTSFTYTVVHNATGFFLFAGCPPSAEALTYGFLQLQKKIKGMSRVQQYFRA